MQKNQTPPPTSNELNNSDLIEYSISVNIPDEIRTRDAATATIGESGLYEFPERTIDKLWYAIYNQGSLISNYTKEGNSSGSFKVTFKLQNDQSIDNLSFFFWAGNKDDISSTSNYVYNLNFDNKFVDLSSKNFYENSNIYDCFAGYYQLKDLINGSSRQISITLKRPFALIHLLTDDFDLSESNVGLDFKNGLTTTIGFGTEALSDSYNSLKIPTRWYFETDTYNYTTQAIKFSNNLTDKVTFKNRQMDYLACLYCFAPSKVSQENEYEFLNFKVYNQYNSATNLYQSVSVPLPESGIIANNQYVIYNKKRSEGGTGFLDDPYYQFNILHDNNWEEPNSEFETDRATN